MSKIGKKIVVSYLIIVLFTVGISMGITKMNFSNKLNAKIIQDLNMAANDMKTEIENELLNVSLALNKEATLYDVFPNNRLFFSSYQFSTTNFVIQDKEKKTIFESWKIKEGEEFYNTSDKTKKFFEMERTIKTPNKKAVAGYLLVIGEKEELGVINSLINAASFIGLAISLFCAVLLALFFERTFIRPINKLKRNIQAFSLEGNNTWEEIRTQDEISDLNDEFKKMAENMIHYDQNQKVFFQNTSHELKTPLMSIQGYAEAIRDNVIPQEDVQESLDIIIDETNKLTHTVDTIVYMTKLENPTEKVDKNRVQSLDMRDFVNEVLYKFKFSADEKSVVLHNNVEDNIFHRVDEEYMFRIINNLISNSLRYAKSLISIEGYHQGNELVLKVVDDGQGFDKAEIDRVFDRFFKGEGGNTGLGLSIVKSTVKQLKGSVRAYNPESGGACVEVRLPRQPHRRAVVKKNDLYKEAVKHVSAQESRWSFGCKDEGVSVQKDKTLKRKGKKHE